MWGSDSDQGDDCVQGVETDAQTDGRSLAEEEEDGTPPFLPGLPKKTARLDQGQRLLASTQHAGDETAMTSRAERNLVAAAGRRKT